ncbi:MAG: hypothetical protein JMN25_00820 [gamma proteobacterium endosymbiont of Lamellibrachia anaximandri]|nr:hypothetical protein [gamma proteobacterium endosymbiont of Lamellibrachia anaximandri]
MNMTTCPALFTSNLPSCAENQGGGDCIVERCGYARKILESIHLIGLGARIGLASHLTGLEKKTLKRIYRQLMGRSSPSGQLPFSDTWFLENEQRLFHATLVWQLHRRLCRPDCSPARLLIDIFEVYTQLVQEPVLNLARTSFAIQLFTTGLWSEHQCSFCGMAFPAPADSKQTICPACQLYHRHRCSHCHAPLVAQSRGRRRTACGHCGNSLTNSD